MKKYLSITNIKTNKRYDYLYTIGDTIYLEEKDKPIRIDISIEDMEDKTKWMLIY